MTLEDRQVALAQAVGGDIKALSTAVGARRLALPYPPEANSPTAAYRLHVPSNYAVLTGQSAANIPLHRLHAWPVLIETPVTFNALGARTSGAGALFDLAIYSMLPNALPGALIVGATGVPSAVGMIFGSVAQTTLPPGWYCAALNVSATGVGVYGAMLGYGYGRPDTSASSYQTCYISTAAGSLPAAYGAPAAYFSAGAPVIALRLA